MGPGPEWGEDSWLPVVVLLRPRCVSLWEPRNHSALLCTSLEWGKQSLYPTTDSQLYSILWVGDETEEVKAQV